MSSFTFATQQTSIYLGVFALTTGIIGGILNTIVFLSLQTFRQNSSAFYLTLMSIVNIGELLAGQLTRILISGFSIDWTQTSIFFCKFRIYILQVCGLISMTCVCLAIIDQYFSTCSHPRWQQWSNIKIAHRILGIAILFWSLFSIPYLISYGHILLVTTRTQSCTIVNADIQQFSNYVTANAIIRIILVIIIFVFGLLAYQNVHKLSHRTLPLLRRELDKQITVMILVQVVITILTTTPYSIVYFVLLIPGINQDPVTAAQLQFVLSITTSVYYLYFSSPFYIYICASGRFRRQLKYVLFDIHLTQCRQYCGTLENQIEPQSA